MTALVIDDDEIILQTIPDMLELLNLSTIAVDNPLKGLSFIEVKKPEIILCDLSMPSMSGLEVLQKTKDIHPDSSFIVMTGYASVESAVNAMRLGAADYIQKPFSMEHLGVVIRRVLEERKLRQENVKLKEELISRYQFHNIIGKSQVMQKVFSQVEKVAPTNASVLIYGESGTGKEMIAKAIHSYSLRKNKPFTGIDCVSIPSHLLESELFGYEKGAFTGADQRRIGIIEATQEGTFFLDEVTEIDHDVQAKLLRMLQERQLRRVGGRELIDIDVRILAATKREPLQAVEEKVFREDLYYRLNVIPISLPPLRERREDIPLLVQHFIKESSEITKSKAKIRINSDALNSLIHYNWPGNIRELRNIVERLCIMANDNCITIDDVPPDIRNARQSGINTTAWLNDLNFKDAKEKWLEQFEKDYIRNALKECKGNISKAAENCGVNRRTFHRLIDKHGISDFKNSRK